MRIGHRILLAGLLGVGLTAFPAWSQTTPSIALEQMTGNGPDRLALRILFSGYVPRTPDDPELTEAIAALEGHATTDFNRKTLAKLYALRAATYRPRESSKAEADFDTAIRLVSAGDTKALEPERQALILRKAQYLANLGPSGSEKAIELFREIFDTFDPARLSADGLADLQNQALQTYTATAVALVELSLAQGRPNEARSWVEQTLAKIGTSPSPLAQERILALLYSFAMGLGSGGDAQAEALTVLDKLLARGKTALSGDRYPWLARSLTAKGLLLRKLGRSDEAAAVETELLDSYRDDSDLMVALAVLVTRVAQAEAKDLPPQALADAYQALAAEYEPKLQQAPSLVNTPPGPLAAMIIQVRLRQANTLGRLRPQPLQEIIRASRAAVAVAEAPEVSINPALVLSARITLATAYAAIGPFGAAPALDQLDRTAAMLDGQEGAMADQMKLTELIVRGQILARLLPQETEQLAAVIQEVDARFKASQDPRIRQIVNQIPTIAAPPAAPSPP